MSQLLTLAYITARREPEFHWFFDSLQHQIKADDDLSIIVVDGYQDPSGNQRAIPLPPPPTKLRHIEPKPCLWQGKHRITKEDWWSASNARNTAICMCKTEWIAFLDDRCVLLDGWLESIRYAMDGLYAVCGPYTKRVNMVVENGFVKEKGTRIGVDCRRDEFVKRNGPNPCPCPGDWLFGCNLALPLEWALLVNGYDEDTLDSLSMEDTIFGMHLSNNHLPIKYDLRLRIVEDRTPSLSGPVIRRTDKGISPNDKSHAAKEKLKKLKRSTTQWDLRQVRADVMSGKPWPIPTTPTHDWYDQQAIKDF